MTKKVSVILLEDVVDVGRVGDVVSVAEGFARNSLFPDGKAALAESSTGKQVQRSKQKAEKEKNKAIGDAKAFAEKLDGTELVLKAKVKEGEGDEIFGSITAKHIAEALSKQTSESFSAKQISLDKPIRSLGTTPVTLALLPDVEAQIQVTIEADEEA